MATSRFLLIFLVFLILLALPPITMQEFAPAVKILIPGFWRMFIVFAILTLAVYLFAAWRMSVSYRASGQALLGTIAVKFFFYMVIAFVYISAHTVEPLSFLASFFYLYFFHTVFEIYCLMRNLRNQNFK